MQLVVTIYEDDISWIDNIPDHWDVVVYLKRPYFPKVAGKLSKRAKVVVLHNIGRESHSLFHHISENYDSLHNVTLFLQGTPSGHTPKISSILKETTLEGIGDKRYFVTPDQDQIIDFDLGFVGIGLYGLLNLNYRLAHNHKFLKETDAIRFTWEKFATSIPQKICPDFLRTCYGNQFAITSDLIRTIPLATYAHVCNMHREHYIMPWVTEKIIPEIFFSFNPNHKLFV